MKTRKVHLWVLIAVLLVLGSSLFCYRHLALGVPLYPQQQVSSWMVEASLKFKAKKDTPIKATFIVPYMPAHYVTLDEYFVSYNYGVTSHVENGNRQTVWSIRRAKGEQNLYYRAMLRSTKSDGYELPKPQVLQRIEMSGAQKSAAEAMTAEARKLSADIETFSQAVLKALNQNGDSAKALLDGNVSQEAKVKAASLVLAEANIHSMPIKVLLLKAQSKAVLMPWLSVYNGDKWLYFNPQNATKGLSDSALLWQYGDAPLYTISGGNKAQFNLTVSPSTVSALNIAKIRGTQTASKMMKFSLLQLPLTAQDTYKVLLTVPIGSFVILLLRNFLGLLTFGTFMPVLIALAFRETHVIWGTVLFSLIVSVGLLARFYLDQLRLLVVPRLATILCVVIILMLAISIFSNHLGVQSGLSVALFPMVILTMVIERMCVTWDERGAKDAILAGCGSLVAAVICYTAMNNSEVEYLMFAFPELIFVLMAVILLFGQYRGYRLSELIRFKSFKS